MQSGWMAGLSMASKPRRYPFSVPVLMQINLAGILVATDRL